MNRQAFIFLLIFTLVSLNLISQDQKKVEYNISLGIASTNAENLYTRFNGIDTLTQQYTRFYNKPFSSSGKIEENKTFIPVDLSINYYFSEKFYLTGGIEFSFSKSSSNKNYAISWDNFSEDHIYMFENNVSILFPHMGIGYRHKSFSFFGSLGFGFVKLDHQQDFTINETINRYEDNQTFKVTGSQPGFKIGLRYRIIKFKKQTVFVKLEYLYLNIKKLTGTKEYRATSSIGGGFSESKRGSLYLYDWNPFEMGFFEYWDLHESTPQDPFIQNARELALNFSSLRLMIGFSF